jgi:hypothetical protein
MLGWTTGNLDAQDSSRPRLGRNHHIPPYSIFCTCPQRPHPNGFLSRDSQVGVSKFPLLGLSRLWEPIIFLTDLWLQCNLKQSCSPRRKLSNSMSQSSCTRGNWVNSWLLVVGSQTGSMILGPSFGHNLCFRCSNEQCEPIFDIYVSIDFQWYEELLTLMGFDPCNRVLKIRECIWDSNSHNESSLGSVRVHSFTFFAFLGTSDVTLGSSFWPVTLQPLTLVASPKLGLRHSHCNDE